MATPIRLDPNLSQISTHLQPVAQNILSFLTTEQTLPANQIMAPFVDLARCRQLGRTWRALAERQQTSLMERIRIANCPSIPPGPDLLARCGAFFRSVMGNIEQGVCAGRRVTINEYIGEPLVESGSYRGNALFFEGNQFILANLETRQIQKRFSAAATVLGPFSARISNDGKIVAEKVDLEHRTLCVWDAAQEGPEPLHTIVAPQNFSRFCVTGQMAVCLNKEAREIFCLDLNRGTETGNRIPTPPSLDRLDVERSFGRIEASREKVYLVREDAIQIFDLEKRAFEREVALPDDGGESIIFNDKLFHLRIGTLSFFDPEEERFDPIQPDPAIAAAARHIPRAAQRDVGGLFGHRHSHTQFLDKLAVTNWPQTQIYDLNTRRHLLTLDHDLAYYAYTAFFEGKLHVAGWHHEHIPHGVNLIREVEIFDFNPAQNIGLLPALNAPEQSYIAWFLHSIGDFFTWLWNCLRGCLGL